MRRVRAVVVSSALWCYENCWLRSFARSMLRFLGFIFWGAAAALAFGGVSVILMYKTYGYLFQEFFLSLPGWLAVAAALVLLLTGALAISVSAKRSRYRQGVLMYLLLVLLCLETSSAVLAQFYSIRISPELKRTMSYLVYQYNGTPPQDAGSRAVDAVQRQLQCCGVQNYTDWLKPTAVSWHLPGENAHVPESCCKEKYSHCGDDLGHLEQLFQEGCVKKLEDWLHFVMDYMFWCCTVLSTLELLAAVSNGFLLRHQPFRDLRFLDSSTFI
ncbi:PREDICTED: tetraspanin-3-like [Buceros rhinoceros silvestris]|uniref:tetraspanin-3-like n=1 Tax=Buceros rhinoceros silvestris TaxID=175836 RepID=UPI0005284A4D|nr:PREDICTED: tetraspanin-3-like [Buceros rhinoceros silvestris]